jgi:TPR repeat protein/tRNA A-37 threonylcarbamoyl transferase component Bud32
MLEVGVLVGGDYRVERKLSEGGMGAVFVAEQVSTGAKRALKVIRPELLRHGKLRDRFAQEAKVTARIASDHVVSVVAAGVDADLGLPWIAMELLHGETLHGLVATRGALPPELAIAVLRQLAHAIDAAHAAQVVHRDLKPDNVFLATSRMSGVPFFVKVLDFGIARILHEAFETKTESLGTPLWMAPEQAGSGDPVGPWTDVWAFGLIAFFLLTGRPYWKASMGEASPLAIVREVCLDPLEPASMRARALGFDGDLGEGFDAWFAECVARDPKDRAGSVGVATERLARVFGVPGSASETVVFSEPPIDAATSSVAHAKTEVAIPGTPAGTPVPVITRPPPDASRKERETPISETPGQAPPVSVTQPSLGAPPKPRSRTPLVVAALAVLLAGAAGLGVRARTAAADREACASKADAKACEAACARGDRPSCVGLAKIDVRGRDVNRARAAADLLRGACTSGDGAACGALGLALAFPPKGGLARDLKEAATALESACKSGQACAVAGALRGAGGFGLSRAAQDYFDASCKETPVGYEAHLDCLYALGHDLATNAPSARVFLPKGFAARTCATYPGDACGFVWVDGEAAGDSSHEAYERGCEAGSSLACTALAATVAEGAKGRAPSPIVARETFERACADGEAAACNDVGFLLGGFLASPRRGPRGELVYKLRCAGAIEAGCASFGERREVLPKGSPTDPRAAYAAFDRACREGLTTACVNQAALLHAGLGVPRDRAAAEKLFSDACMRGDAGACGEQGAELLTVRLGRSRDVRAGLSLLERACKGGEEDSCTALYGHLVNGLPDGKRVAEGVAGLVAQGKRKVVSHVLVELYETGAEGHPKDLSEAARLAISICDAESRCADAAYFLSRGLGVAKDDVRATEALQRGCENDDFPSCTELGIRYREGRGQSKDPHRAVELFRKACDGADATACDMLSQAYATAEGVPRDLTKAFALARAACDTDGVEGCASVGIMTADGKGTPKDVDAALPYLSFACRRAVQLACAKLLALGKPLPELDM